ncbi:protein TRANPARENT TESTA 12-like [Canna indica]|uniref:Protein TRANPARENT TESTA 12-like n=1 Tax=Canna indica TaxID=4628 RepID=A0AAQ3JQ75_9LILI|nr:protein TRANPARENT TESTA 12-like [Canna indica]
MWIVVGPTIFTRFSSVSIISQSFISHVGSVELASYALVFTVLTCFANGILVLLLSPRVLFSFHRFYYVKFRQIER